MANNALVTISNTKVNDAVFQNNPMLAAFQFGLFANENLLIRMTANRKQGCSCKRRAAIRGE